MNELHILFGVFIFVFLIIGIFGLGSYILKSIGMYTIAERKGMNHPWLAWIPFARIYLNGELAGPIKLRKKTIQSPGLWLLLIPFIMQVITSVIFGIYFAAIFAFTMDFTRRGGSMMHMDSGLISGIIVAYILLILFIVLYSAIYMILKVLVGTQIFQNFTTRNMAMVHSIFCYFIPMYDPICYFVMRNRPLYVDDNKKENNETNTSTEARDVVHTEVAEVIEDVTSEVVEKYNLGNVTEAAIVVEDAPVVEPTEVVEDAPIVKESPIIEEAPIVEETPIIESAPIVEESVVTEKATEVVNEDVE